MTRRRLVNWLLGTTLGALAGGLLYPILRFLDPPRGARQAASQIEAGRTDDPAFRERGYKIVRLGGEPVIVVRAGPDDFRAFSATCTHLACIVEYRSSSRLLWCNCHDGRFDLQGQVVGGPPPRPLATFRVELQAGAAGAASILVQRA